ncbi:MAG: relaxase/mobilization nuclease domain-containing protein [Eubacterium sp.]|nr:relaxase/mobilization nuclease domain-containing protein [Eubacterium sp.]MBR0412418.1 relaxase/mobilization nuclease domain-containing protein [Eubacterium sp.]
MPIVKFVKNSHQSKTALQKSIEYVSQEKKTLAENRMRYVSGINCNGLNAYNEMMLTRSAYPFKGTNSSERFFYQYIQAFDSKDDITADEVHAIGLEFAERAWTNHQVLVATHVDRGHMHNHFIISPINLETGNRLRQSPQTLKHLRKLSDDICQQRGAKVLKPYDYNTPSGLAQGELRAAEKGASWKFELMFVIDAAMKQCKNKHDFFEFMKKYGYQVKWTSERKYITYTCPNGMRCRCVKLHEEKYRKEEMEYEFKIRQLEAEERRQHSENGAGDKSDNRRFGTVGGADKYGQESQRADEYESAGSTDNGNGAKSEPNQAGGAGPDEKSQNRAGYSVEIHDGQYCRTDGSVITTGWESERAVWLANEQSGGSDFGYQKETDSASDWHHFSRPGVISDSLYFAGNLFEMIDNQRQKPHRKHARLSQKEKEKKLAHGQKIDDDGWEQTM